MDGSDQTGRFALVLGLPPHRRPARRGRAIVDRAANAAAPELWMCYFHASMAAQDLTGRSPDDTTASRLLAEHGLRLPVVAVSVVVVFEAALILAFTLERQPGATAATLSVGTIALPALALTLLGLAVGLFDGWQIQEPGRTRRVARIAGHGLLGALVGVTVGGIAIIGAFLLVQAIRLLFGLLA